MTTVDESTVALEPVKRMSRDLAASGALLSTDEARYLVDAYYMIQDSRIRAGHQLRQLQLSAEPHEVIAYLAVQDQTLENQIKRVLDKWSDAKHMGRWAKAVVGIGPVIASGLLAHIDITKAPTAGHIWRFAGLDPTTRWEKGKKRPYNASLKTLCAFKMGESFVKNQNREGDVYGKLFAKRKQEYAERNEAGGFAENAKAALERKKFAKDTDAYKAYSQGKLPPAHLHAMARRYAVKIFLSHYHAEAYREHFKREPPFPFAIAILGHAHLI